MVMKELIMMNSSVSCSKLQWAPKYRSLWLPLECMILIETSRYLWMKSTILWRMSRTELNRDTVFLSTCLNRKHVYPSKQSSKTNWMTSNKLSTLQIGYFHIIQMVFTLMNLQSLLKKVQVNSYTAYSTQCFSAFPAYKTTWQWEQTIYNSYNL